MKRVSPSAQPPFVAGTQIGDEAITKRGLHLPAKKPERLSFGVEPAGRDEQTITEAYIAPVYRAASHVATTMRQSESGRLGA